MPLEVSEIAVRMAVGDGKKATGRDDSGTEPGDPCGGCAPLPPDQMEEIIARCVRQVLLAMRRQEAR
ncbi:hypothetical protein GE253_13585 [Niveispirillum sp. SYP-B3756]|uniref:DUF5908 family protein n=1 Tax=Niveispirillum sp. SYP-B3756 TaxID=2662178 RepID=UPI0012922818|nr:DUF5908 family protein [Niveispirillum sp. SYP-B3756]MQP66371.1 hypothetical protein [Niveispirillum sp. SYP-B3756]